jgi:hypothetical protein
MVARFVPTYFACLWVTGWLADGNEPEGGRTLSRHDSYAEALEARRDYLAGRGTLRRQHGEGYLCIVNHNGSLLWAEPQLRDAQAMTVEELLLQVA